MQDFPKWNPQQNTLRLMRSYDLNIRKKVVRNSASNFISKSNVRKTLFELKGDKCYICGAKATQIDHKISAAAFASDITLDIWQLNCFDNLYPICAKCNNSKTP